MSCRVDISEQDAEPTWKSTPWPTSDRCEVDFEMLHKLGKITIGRWRDGGKFGETGSPAGYRGCIGFGNEESLPYKGSHFENGRFSDLFTPEPTANQISERHTHTTRRE